MEDTGSIELVKAKIALAHANEHRYQIRLMYLCNNATREEYERAIYDYVDAYVLVSQIKRRGTDNVEQQPREDQAD